MTEGTRTGRRGSSFDALIATIPQVNDCVLVTGSKQTLSKLASCGRN